VNYTGEELAILNEFKLATEDGELVIVNLKEPKANPKGLGPKLDPQVIKTFFGVDPSFKWTRWIFFQAGGGSRAKEASVQCLDQVKDRLYDERLSGPNALTRKEVDKLWNSVKDRYKMLAEFADEDVVQRTGSFGYYRSWPGGEKKIYEDVVTAAKSFLALGDKVEEMNQHLRRSNLPEISSNPNDYGTVEQLRQTTTKVKRFYASRVARENIQVVQVYEDDAVSVLVPLTYAASMRYGYKDWQWSDPTQFENLLTSEHSFSDQWKRVVSLHALAFINFKVPMPSWIVRRGDNFARKYLANIAVQLPIGQLKKLRIDDLVLIDEENIQTKLSAVLEVIYGELTRSDDPQAEEWPVKRGPRIWKTEAEAEAAANHLRHALYKLAEWAKTFDANRIVQETMKV